MQFSNPVCGIMMILHSIHLVYRYLKVTNVVLWNLLLQLPNLSEKKLTILTNSLSAYLYIVLSGLAWCISAFLSGMILSARSLIADLGLAFWSSSSCDTFLIFNKYDMFWSMLTSLSTNKLKHVLTSLILSKPVQTCPKMFKFVQTCLNLFKIDQSLSNLFKLV